MRYTPAQTEEFFLQRLDILGITQAELGIRAGFTAADISRYKQQKQRPRIEHIEQLALALELDVIAVMIGLGAIDPDAVTTPTVVSKAKGKASRIKWSR